MSASISTLSFIRVDGRPTPRGAVLRDVTPEGATAPSVLIAGTRAPLSRLVSTAAVANAAAVKTHIDTAVALKNGTTYTYTDDHGSTWPVIVWEVRLVDSRGVLNASSGAYLVRLEWVLEVVEAAV